MVPGLGRYPGGGHAALNHRVGVRLGEGGRGELAGAAPNGAEQWPLGVVAQACAVEIGGKLFLEIMVARHFVALAAFLAQPHPQGQGGKRRKRHGMDDWILLWTTPLSRYLQNPSRNLSVLRPLPATTGHSCTVIHIAYTMDAPKPRGVIQLCGSAHTSSLIV